MTDDNINALECAVLDKKLAQLDDAYETMQDHFKQLTSIFQTMPRSREVSIAITELEGAMLWAQHSMNSYRMQLISIKAKLGH